MCYTAKPSKGAYGPPPVCATAAEIATKVTASGFVNCLEQGIDTFTPSINQSANHARRYTYSEVSDGFIEIIDLGSFGSSKADAEAQWAELVATNWLDKQSREMVIQIMTYNANTGLYGIGTLSFQLNVGGVFKRRLSVESYVISHQYMHGGDYFRLMIEIIFFGWTVCGIFSEFYDMKRLGCFEYWDGEAGVWNVIDWLASFALVANLALWITIVVTTGNWDLPERPVTLDDVAVRSVEEVWSNYATVNQLYVVYGGTNVISLLFMIVRLLKNLNYHPKLAIVSKTIGYAAEELIHFSIVFIIIVCVYSFMGMVIAGRQMREFASFDRSVIHLVLVSLGEFSAWEELYLISPYVGSLFFFSYIAVVTVLMMNIILSIIVDSFIAAGARSASSTSVFADAALTLMIDFHLGTLRTVPTVCTLSFIDD
tara:strand:+ start:59 stop:1339 length:1281 start_codon:yes stop_codon:yes gene_type:complete